MEKITNETISSSRFEWTCEQNSPRTGQDGCCCFGALRIWALSQFNMNTSHSCLQGYLNTHTHTYKYNLRRKQNHNNFTTFFQKKNNNNNFTTYI
jgi:hypothetical protein